MPNRLTLAEMARQVRERRLSPVELVDAHLAAIERENPRLNAFISIYADEARAEARRKENQEPVGPLHGVPITIKDSFDIAGKPTTGGSTLRRDAIAGEDSVSVARLRRAGAIILGKTNLPEFLLNYESDNNLIGRTTSDVQLSLKEKIVETPRKANMGWAPDLEKYLRKDKAGDTIIRLPLRFLRINNDVAVWAAPLELFCEIAMTVRNQSPFPYTFYFGYSNGWLGYMPTKAEFTHGGYEPSVSPYTPQVEDDVLRTVVSYLQGSVR